MKFPHNTCSRSSLIILHLGFIENNKNGCESGFSSDDQLLSSDEETSSFTSDSSMTSSNSSDSSLISSSSTDTAFTESDSDASGEQKVSTSTDSLVQDCKKIQVFPSSADPNTAGKFMQLSAEHIFYLMAIYLDLITDTVCCNM